MLPRFRPLGKICHDYFKKQSPAYILSLTDALPKEVRNKVARHPSVLPTCFMWTMIPGKKAIIFIL